MGHRLRLPSTPAVLAVVLGCAAVHISCGTAPPQRAAPSSERASPPAERAAEPRSVPEEAQSRVGPWGAPEQERTPQQEEQRGSAEGADSSQGGAEKAADRQDTAAGQPEANAAATGVGAEQAGSDASESRSGGDAAPEAEQTKDEGEPVALARPQLLEHALTLSPGNTVVVREDGSPLSVYHDLEPNSLTDVAVVTVEGLDQEQVTFEELSQMGRLFRNDTVSPGFYVEVYAQRAGGTVVPLHTFYLGRKTVLGHFEKVSIAADAPLPVALSTLFVSPDGEERNWATFSPGGQISLFIIQDTPTVRNAILDIDGDELLDVLEYRTSFEEGRGYETFVSWYRWSGSSFARHRTTNVVRNLNSFLETLAARLQEGSWEAFVERATTPAQREALLPELEPQVVLQRLLEPLRSQGEEPEPAHQFLQESEPLQAVVLPDILENPFPQIGTETSFTAPIRIVCCGGVTQYYSAEVVMRRNLFEEQQFFLELAGN